MKPCKISCCRCGDFVRKSTDEELKKTLKGGIIWATCEKCVEQAKLDMEQESHRRYQIASLKSPMYLFMNLVLRWSKGMGDVTEVEPLSEAFIKLMETYEEVK
jgi:hypothetical protein